ncbi:Ger(x)C family spore germination protein [Falsibacillus albus]|uniref:Ger(X)C family spore germination protein n=1 Tax=Falsibacillus albus TaxID=2478915 RepID=A0A3L7K0J0_9BACI|nr:Ger(x)C family spore germination protein [Falsibacillus albus]RLQ96578.1 Ger(x)C family spore germination protein [Falsibacillus albus]
MKKWIILPLCLMILTGCVEQEIIDDLNIETAAGYDKAQGKNILGTALFPAYQKDKTIENVTMSAIGKSSRDILANLEKQSTEPLVTGSLQVVLFGDTLARQGLVPLGDALHRDASIGARIFLAVTEDGTAQSLLQGNYGNRGNGMYIYNLLNHNIKSRDVPTTNLHDFLFDYYQHGKSPFLPLLRQIGPNQMEISGIAVFDQDKYVEKINADHMFFFKLLVDKYSEGTRVVQLKKERAAIRSIDSKNKIKIIRHDGEVSAVISIKVKGIIREYTGQGLNPIKIKQIEKAFKHDVQQHCDAMVKRFQELGVDPIGIGFRVSNSDRSFDIKKWRQQYPNIKITVKPEIIITESGTVE